MKQKGNIISLFLSCIYNDIIKRTKKTFTYYTLNEVTNLPLIFCEKSCLYISPITGELNVHNFTILIKKLFYNSDFNSRLSFLLHIIDFSHKKIIMKSDLKMIMSYLYYSLLNFHTYDMLAELIENFYNKETEMSISSFYSKCKANGDIAYVLFTLIDKFSFRNSYEQMNLLNAEIYNGRKAIEKYVKKDYNITNVSQSANEDRIR